MASISNILKGITISSSKFFSQNNFRWRWRFIPTEVKNGWEERKRSLPMEIYPILSSGGIELFEEC
jgi:hypothetical protein